MFGEVLVAVGIRSLFAWGIWTVAMQPPELDLRVQRNSGRHPETGHAIQTEGA